MTRWWRTGRPIEALLTEARKLAINSNRRAVGAFLLARVGVGRMPPLTKKVFEFSAQWDPEAGVWWCSNDALPVTTEAPTFDELVTRVMEIAPEIAELNGIAPPGEEIEIHIIGQRVQSVPVSAAAA
jgi:Domain of unknown function (DUF1902)